MAILLNNSHVDRQVSRSAPPDVVVIFDEACFTGPRHTVVPFDTDFSVDWRPVLDPKWQDRSAPFLLEEHLHAGADGLVGLRSRLWPDGERRRTRIVIIQGSPDERPIQRDRGSSIPTEHLDSLERLTVFRFGFSVHGAFSILNHGCGRNELKSFPEVRRKLSELRALGFLRYTRGTFFIEPRYRFTLSGSSYLSSAPFQMQAAFALCPLLQPSKKFVSENRDKSLHAENIQEAKWHLSEAVRILPPKEQAYRMQAIQARKSLALIPRIADWDTFNELHRRGSVLLPDAYVLASELFASARHVAASEGRDFQDLGHRPGKLLNVIGDYGAQIKKKQGADGANASASPALEPTLEALTEECHHLFRELGGGAEVPKRVARRTATHYEEAAALLGTEIDKQAQDVIGRCLGEIDDDAYLECSVEAFLDTYLIPKWWKWKIYSEGDQARRRELCRLASRSELMKSVHTDWDQKFEEPWTIFFRDLPDHGCEADLSEMLSLWWKARGSDLERRARYRDVVLGLRGQRGSLFENYVDVLQRGGSNLLARISRSLLSEEDEMYALAYVAALNLSDPVIAYDLVSNWRNSTPRDRGIPLNLDEWIGRSDSRGEFVGALVANPGSWAAMLCEAPEHRLSNQASAWAIARRVKQPADMPAVNPLLLNTIRNDRIKKKWKLAAERAGTLESEVRKENARILVWVSKELLALAEGS